MTRCTSLICDTISGLPWQVFRGDYDQLPTPDWILDPQALRPDVRIVDPSTLLEVRLSAVEFWANWIVAALWFGDGYLYVPVRDVDRCSETAALAAPPLRRPDPRRHLLGQRHSPTRRHRRASPRSGPLLERARPRGHHRTRGRPRPGRHPPNVCDRSVQHGSTRRLLEVDPTEHDAPSKPKA